MFIALCAIVKSILPFEGQDRLREKLEPKAEHFLVQRMKPLRKLVARLLSDLKSQIPPIVLYTASVLLFLSFLALVLWNLRGRTTQLSK
jgi:hypothetical protein